MMSVVLITGTSTGLGISLVLQLAEQGHKVYATMRNLAKQQALVAAIAEKGVSAEIMVLDVQNQESVEACVDQIIQQEGRIDVLINNAGAGFVKTTEHTTDDEIHKILDINFTGVVRCTRAVLPHMRQQRSGRIVNVSSVGGLVGQPFNEIYCAAKFALEGYTESLASYIEPNFNIRFTVVEPGGIRTEFANNVLAQFQQAGGMIDDEYKPILEKYIGSAGNNRSDDLYQTADEVAAVIVGSINDLTPPFRLRTSNWSNDFCELKTAADPTGDKQIERVRRAFL
ncbi:SDR family oxidoreductase [Marinomonas agarivorans]|nr:SDR family oxidoreductase [Marinomonas agarivorans]